MLYVSAVLLSLYCQIVFFLFFFFSSRRRHTRLQGDWSSDVCSSDLVTVEALAANINYDSNTIEGVVTRQQVDDLPLNGRSFLNLAQLEPGIQVTPANPAQFNAQFSVSVLGGPASRTAITVDGGNVRNPVEGGSGTNFSQEVVQEFQLSSTNFDLSTGITAFGAVNVVTRSGGNDFHGAGYFYFRDNNTAAYPSLDRNPFVANL